MNFSNQTEILTLLSNLDASAQPKFGLMTPQHTVEHLVVLVQISNGKKNVELTIKEETAAKWKQNLLYTDTEFPKGFKAPMLPKDSLLPLQFNSLNDAIS